jgi:hypothetical protein
MPGLRWFAVGAVWVIAILATWPGYTQLVETGPLHSPHASIDASGRAYHGEDEPEEPG